MKHRYPTEKELMAALRAQSSRRVATASAKARPTRRREQAQAFPACYPWLR